MKRLLTLATLLLAAAPAAATVAMYLELPELVAESNVIVHGRVVSQTFLTDPAGRPSIDTTLLVLDSYKGDRRPGGAVVIRQRGGPVGQGFMRVPGDATFADGEEVVVLLRDVGDGHLYLSELAQSKYTVTRGTGGTLARRDLSDLGFYQAGQVGGVEEPPVSLPILESVLRGSQP